MDAADWDERYREKQLLWSKGPNRFVVDDLGDLETGSALDVACGEGRNAVWLAERGWRVTGVDFSSVALERARSMAATHGVEVEWIEADIREWDPGRRYDLVLVAYVHLPPPDREALMRKVVTWVAPGGRLFLVGHDVSSVGVSGPPYPELLWDPDLARKSASPLEVILAERRVRETEDGRAAVDTLLLAQQPRLRSHACTT